ncbi:MAG: hypothetical protein HY521_00455 [Proteobacteria bacterium]|nr:hypothetical protein [Pseudomonadota bacterium]
MQDKTRFATLRAGRRVWALSAVHGELARLKAVHDHLEPRLGEGDRLVYLGNVIGRGTAARETIDEVLLFRRAVIARPGVEPGDVVFLRGSQEEMWHKLLQLQFAPNPVQVLTWLLDHGVGATLTAYGGRAQDGLMAAREGATAIARWTNSLRRAIRQAPGHESFMGAIRRAAFTDDGKLLFVHAGIDPTRPLSAQKDALWWGGGAGFLALEAPYAGFRRVIRGYDPAHAGLKESPHSVSLDGGCGFGGPLLAACFDAEGAVLERVER